MCKKNLKFKIVRLILLLGFFYICIPGPLLFASDKPSEKWIEFETQYTKIRYTSPQILDHFQKTIQFGHGWWAATSTFATLTHEENQKITQLKVDAIFERVQEILDMKKRFNKVIIHLHPDRPSLNHVYEKEYKKKNNYRAWYEFNTNTIHLDIQESHEGVVAHELSHSIIDNFLQVRPPANTAEILARYVDKHLK